MPSPAGPGREKGNAANRARSLAYLKTLLPIVREIQVVGDLSRREIADELNARKIPAPKGGLWNGAGVSRLLARLESEL